jgi:hypothetical protein
MRPPPETDRQALDSQGFRNFRYFRYFRYRSINGATGRGSDYDQTAHANPAAVKGTAAQSQTSRIKN